MTPLERRVDVSRAYDLRGKGPQEYGIAGCDITFYVIGLAGAVQCKIMTDWYPASARDPKFRMSHAVCKPWITDIGYHSREPKYEGQTPMAHCHLLGDNACYYDGSSLNENWEEGLVNGGSDWLWSRLEALYRYEFEEGEYPDLSYEKVPYPTKREVL